MTEEFISLDELAGIVDLFGTLTRDAVDTAIVEMAFRQGIEVESDTRQEMITTAINQYRLIIYPSTEDEMRSIQHPSEQASDINSNIDETKLNRIAPGPTAFPTLPAHAEDLPRILETDGQAIDHEAATYAVINRLRDDTEQAITNNDIELMRYLRDVTYDIETWAGVATANDDLISDVRCRLNSALAED